MPKKNSTDKMLQVKFQEEKFFWYKDGADAKPEKITRPQLDAKLAKAGRVWDAQATYRKSDLSSVKFNVYPRSATYLKTPLKERLRLAQAQLVIVNYKDESRGFGVEIHPEFLGKTSHAAIPYNGPFVSTQDKLYDDASREVLFVAGVEESTNAGAFAPEPGHIHYFSLVMHAPSRDQMDKIYFYSKETKERMLVSNSKTTQELGPRGVPWQSMWPLLTASDSRFPSISYGWDYFAVRNMPMYLTDKETGQFIPSVNKRAPLYLLPKYITVENPTEDVQTVQLPGIAFRKFFQDIEEILLSAQMGADSALESPFILGVLSDNLLLAMPDINMFVSQARSNNLNIDAKIATMVVRSGADAYNSLQINPRCVLLDEYMKFMIKQARSNDQQARVNTFRDLNILYGKYNVNDADRCEDFKSLNSQVSAEMSVPKSITSPGIVLNAALVAAIKKNLSDGAKTASLTKRGMFLISSLEAFELAADKQSGRVVLSKGVQFIPLTLATKALIDSGKIPADKSVRLLFCEDMLSQAKTFSESKSKANEIKARYIVAGIIRSKKKIDPQFSTQALDEGLTVLRKQFSSKG